jgi:hypothetical protein
VFENRELRRMFEPKRGEVTGEWRKLHNEKLNDLYRSPNIVREIKSRRMRWVGNVARMGERRGVYRVLVGKREGKRPLGRPRRIWEDNIKMDLIEKNEIGGACSAYGGVRGVYRVVVGKLEGKRPLGRPRRIWEDKIKMDLIEKNEIGGACSAYGGEERRIQGFGGEN